MSDHAELSRLVLRLERDLLVQAQLRRLLAATDTAVASHRLDVRNLKARMARRRAAEARTE